MAGGLHCRLHALHLYLSTAYARNAGLALDQATVDLNATGYGLASGKTSMVGMAVGIRHKF